MMTPGERSREQWGGERLETIRRELLHALRSLRRTPVSSTVIVLTLAVVLGAGTAIFGLLDALFLQRLDLPRPEQLVAVQMMNEGRLDHTTAADYEQLKNVDGAPRLEAYRFATVSVGPADDRVNVTADLVSPGYFELLGAQPRLGRLPGHGDAADAAVAVISTALWTQHFGADSSAIGRTLLVNDVPVTVIGVMAPQFTGVHFARRFSIAMPLRTPAVPADRTGVLALELIARIGPDRVSAAAALSRAYRACCVGETLRSDLTAEASAVESLPVDDGPTGWIHYARSSDRTPHAQLTDASRGLIWSADMRGAYRRVLLAISGGVLLLLVITCANVGTVLFVRAVGRRREFAVMLALGAGRLRLMRQLLLESLLLAFAGAAGGLVIAAAGTSVLARNLPPSVRQLDAVIGWQPRASTVLFAAVAAFVCTALFGLLPALRAGRTDVQSALNDGPARLRGFRITAIDRGLAALQIALALVLVCAASMLAATLRNLSTFDRDVGGRMIVAHVDAGGTRFDAVPLGLLADEVLRTVRGVPGVAAAALAADAPMMMDMQLGQPYEPENRSQRERAPSFLNPVSAGYFELTRIPLRAGREFGTADGPQAEGVAVVSESWARRWYPDGGALGAMLSSRHDATPAHVRIIGIAADVPYDDPRERPREMVYVPLTQTTHHVRQLAVLLRPHAEQDVDPAALRAALQSIAAGTSVTRVSSMRAVLEDALARERLAAGLGTLFGALALLLVALGVYGLLSHSTTRRRHEIGVRLALGATPANALLLVLRQAAVIAALGLAAGLPAALALGYVLRAQLFGIDSRPAFVLASGALLVIVALLASLAPAARAARVDPLVALRTD